MKKIVPGHCPTFRKEAEEVQEERIEITCADELVVDVVAAIRAAHSYEEPVIDIYLLKD